VQEEEARGEAARDEWEEPALPLAAMVFQCREEHQGASRKGQDMEEETQGQEMAGGTSKKRATTRSKRQERERSRRKKKASCKSKKARCKSKNQEEHESARVRTRKRQEASESRSEGQKQTSRSKRQ